MTFSDSLVSGWMRAHMRDIRETAARTYRCTIDFDPAFPGFAGHFEGNPIVPGVCMTAEARILAESVLDRELTPAALPQCRFRRPIRAGESAELTLRMDETETGLQMQAELRVEGAIAAQLRLKEAAR